MEPVANMPLDEHRPAADPELDRLIASSLSGDQHSYRQLYDRFAPGIYRLCYGLLFHRQDAEDVLQETFVYAFKNLRRFDATKSAFKTWLYTIAVSRCRNMYRRKSLPMLDFAQFMQLNIPAPASEAPEAALARQNAEEAIQRGLFALSEPLREAVILRYAHGLTYREIADVMGVPAKTAESRVRLAHSQLRSVLAPIGPGLLDELLRIG